MNKKFQILVVAILPFLLVGCVKDKALYSGVNCDGKSVKKYQKHGQCNFRANLSPLSRAIYDEQFATAKKLIAEGQGINTRSGSCRVLRRELDYTAYAFRYAGLRGISRYKYYCSTRYTHHQAPLHWAVKTDAPSEIIRLLIEKGADVNAKKDGRTPLELAVAKDKTEAIRAFKVSSADIARAKQKEQRRKEAEAAEKRAEAAEERARRAAERAASAAAAARRQQQLQNTLNVYTDAMVDLGNQRRANEAAQRQQQAAAQAAQQAEYERQAAAETRQQEQYAAEEARRQEQAAAEQRRAAAAAEAERKERARLAAIEQKKQQRARAAQEAALAMRCVTIEKRTGLFSKQIVNACNKMVSVAYCCNNKGGNIGNTCDNYKGIGYDHLAHMRPGKREAVSPICGGKGVTTRIHYAACIYEWDSGVFNPKATQNNGVHPTAYKCQ